MWGLHCPRTLSAVCCGCHVLYLPTLKTPSGNAITSAFDGHTHSKEHKVIETVRVTPSPMGHVCEVPGFPLVPFRPAQRTHFSVSFKADLAVKNSLNVLLLLFDLCFAVSVWEYLQQGMFAGYRILGRGFFRFSTLKMYSRVLASMVSAERPDVIYIDPLYGICNLLWYFQDFIFDFSAVRLWYLRAWFSLSFSCLGLLSFFNLETLFPSPSLWSWGRLFRPIYFLCRSLSSLVGLQWRER